MGHLGTQNELNDSKPRKSLTLIQKQESDILKYVLIAQQVRKRKKGRKFESWCRQKFLNVEGKFL